LQAEALAIPLLLIDKAQDYEQAFKEALIKLRIECDVEAVAFGSLYAEEDKSWNVNMAKSAGLKALFPLWITADQTNSLLAEWLALDYKAIICRASAKYFNENSVGKVIDNDFVHAIQKTNACSMGEGGEYHTFVVNGPRFRKALKITRSQIILNEGLWSLDIQDCRLCEKNFNLS
jgi:diphthine-ammonia ligase